MVISIADQIPAVLRLDCVVPTVARSWLRDVPSNSGRRVLKWNAIGNCARCAYLGTHLVRCGCSCVSTRGVFLYYPPPVRRRYHFFGGLREIVLLQYRMSLEDFVFGLWISDEMMAHALVSRYFSKMVLTKKRNLQLSTISINFGRFYWYSPIRSMNLKYLSRLYCQWID